MQDENKTKEQLIQELAAMRRQLGEMEKLENEPKKAEERLRKSEEYFRAITENSSDIIFIEDKKGTITYVSPSIGHLLGYKPEELIGKTALDLIMPDDHPRAIYDFSKAIRTKEIVIPNAFRVRHKDGSERILEGVGKNLLDNPAVEGFVMNVRDVTERRRVDEVLRTSEEEARRLSKEAAVIAEIGRIISSTLNIDEVYERFAAEAQKVIPFDRIAINTINPEDSTVIVSYTAGDDLIAFRPGNVYPLADSMAEVVKRTKSSFLIDVVDEEAIGKQFPVLLPTIQAGFRSLMAVPLLSKEEVIGTLNFRTKKPKVYSEEIKRLAERVATQIAGAIANAQLFAERKQAEEAARRSEEEAKRLAQENAVMAEIGRIVGSTLDIEEVYEHFAEEMHKLISFDRVAVNIIDPKSYTFNIPYVSGAQVTNRQTGEVIPLAGTGTEEILRTRTSILIHEENREAIVSRCPGLVPIIKAGFQSIMMVPLISENEVIGVLNIQSTQADAYTESDLRLAERISSQIAGAIANAKLFVEIKRAEEEREKLGCDLQNALSQVKKLSGFLPICASCKKIRDDKGYWNQVEVYIRDHSEAEFSHGICPDCKKKLYGDFLKEEDISGNQ
ncbi:MAG: PAS domain S-box protein [Deltaproteobacteria bacterium]|nr:PAS domain S-box protein [Deltaproteobacteria bacterium]